MSDGTSDRLELEAAAAGIRHFGSLRGLSVRESGDGGDGLRFALGAAEEPGDVFFALIPLGGGYLSLSLVLVVDEDFFHDHVEDILAVTARYEVCPSLSRDGRLEAGEVYMNLSLRLFLAGFTLGAFELALDNLLAARDALARSFP